MWNVVRKAKNKIIQVPMPEDLLETVDHYSQEQGVSRSSLIREACAEYVTRAREEEFDRQYIESYTEFPEKYPSEEDEWRVRNAAAVWGEEDWSDWLEAGV